MLPTVRDEATRTDKRRRSQPSRPGRMFGALVFIIIFSIMGSRLPSFRTLSSKAQLYQRFKRWNNRSMEKSAEPVTFGTSFFSNKSHVSQSRRDSSTHYSAGTTTKEVITSMHQAAAESEDVKGTIRHEDTSMVVSEQSQQAKKETSQSPPSQE